MTMGRRGIGAALLALLLVIGAGAAGYFVGESEAPTAGEATEAREAANAEARETAVAEAAEASLERGEREGLAEGKRRGEREGRQAGAEAGEAAAGEELAAIEAEEAADTTSAEPAEEPAPGTAGSDVCVKYQDYVPGVGCVPPVAPGETEAPINCPPGWEPAGVTGACAPPSRP